MQTVSKKPLPTDKTISDSLRKLLLYCEKEGFKGYDPYDGLNSRLFQSISLISKTRIARLAWIQFFKRSPINFRTMTGVKKEYNAKALGLFLSSYCNLYKVNPSEMIMDKINFLSNQIIKMQNTRWSGSSWGYNFDWQARAFFQPKNTPTVVASVFVGSALLDAYAINRDKTLLQTARSTCDFILKDLSRTYDSKENFSFSYSPLDKTVVFNASLLGSRLLSRAGYHTGESQLLEAAGKSVAFCIDYQKEDGSWSYGTLPFHQWIDNFHTGYNLECIADYIKYSGDDKFSTQLEKGFYYYIHTFFTPEGIPKYYNDKVYPIDIHASAQTVITLYKLNKLEAHKDLADRVLHWTIRNMQSANGYFYFQINKRFTSKIPYIRWAQAWMLYALTTYEKAIYEELNPLSQAVSQNPNSR